MPERSLPDQPLSFIRQCVAERRVHWTYHVNMRLREHYIPRRTVLESVSEYEIIESYPQDKYLPSYLVWSRHGELVYHVLFAADVPGRNVRVITAYRPDPRQWSEDFKRRQES